MAKNIYGYEHTYEVCPHCGEEVELNAELSVQTCPKCGKRIVACSMCRAVAESDEPFCQNCCLCHQAEVENKEIEEQKKLEKMSKKKTNSEVGRKKQTAKDDENIEQVRLTISTDYGHTADFLRQLANEIEGSEEEVTGLETFRGCATIEWP